jgi:hypothetical protein
MHDIIPGVDIELGEPLLFRTSGADVVRATLKTGSLWLRSDRYFRELEDRVRNDAEEGANSTTTSLPLNVNVGGTKVRIQGSGAIGQIIQPHYLLSLHGTAISGAQRREFGGHTFGVRGLFKLTYEILFQAAQQIKCTGYRYGPVAYQHTPLTFTSGASGAAIGLAHDPPLYLNSYSSDVLRKRPIHPFIEQDEWRIAIFADGYLSNDPNEPLKLHVAASNFYPYLDGD